MQAGADNVTNLQYICDAFGFKTYPFAADEFSRPQHVGESECNGLSVGLIDQREIFIHLDYQSWRQSRYGSVGS